MTSLMKKKGYVKLRTQAIVNFAGMAFALLIVIVSVITSRLLLHNLRSDLMPLLDKANELVQSENFEAVSELSKQIRQIVEDAEPKLEYFANHRDITEFIRFSKQFRLLGADGDKNAYIECITGLNSWMEYMDESNGLTLGIII